MHLSHAAAQALMVAAQGPFDRAFSQQRGAHLTAFGDGPYLETKEQVGGLVGYTAYDAVRFFERLTARSALDSAIPMMRIFFW